MFTVQPKRNAEMTFMAWLVKKSLLYARSTIPIRTEVAPGPADNRR